MVVSRSIDARNRIVWPIVDRANEPPDVREAAKRRVAGAVGRVIQVRLSVPEDQRAPLAVEMSGPLGQARGRVLSMARGAIGAYRPIAFHRHVVGLGAWNAQGETLAVAGLPDGTWRIESSGELHRVTYGVELDSMGQGSGDLLTATRRQSGYLTLVGYGVFMAIEGARGWPHAVELVLPEEWAKGGPRGGPVSWALPRDERGRYRANSWLELADEPALLGRDIHARGEGERFVHVAAADRKRRESTASVLADALAASREGIEALGFPGRQGRFHVLYELFDPDAGDGAAGHRRLGWALEHGLSFHGVDSIAGVAENFSARLVYHVIHHELHTLIPRRLYSDRLHPDRQIAAEPTELIWFAEGLVQYLACLALARSFQARGQRGVDIALRVVANRFAATYLDGGPPGSPSLAEHSLALCAGDHTHWRWHFAAGGLIALWLDATMRSGENGQRGLLEALLDLYREWADHQAGIPEPRFVEVLARACGPGAEAILDRHVRAGEPLPVDAILAGAGIVRDNRAFEIVPASQLDARAARFRQKMLGR